MIFIPHRGRRSEAKIFISHVLFVIKVNQRERLGFLSFLEAIVIVDAFLIVFAKVRRIVRQLHQGSISCLENRVWPLLSWNFLVLVNLLRIRFRLLRLKAVLATFEAVLELLRVKAVMRAKLSFFQVLWNHSLVLLLSDLYGLFSLPPDFSYLNVLFFRFIKLWTITWLVFR